jgi:transcription initiation factor IIF auxiliary subunit
MISIDTNLRLMNDSRAEGDEWWHWTAWIEGPESDLDEVSSVTYLLHPTFTPRTITVDDRSNKFSLVSSAWGEFLLAADVLLKNGSRARLERWLELGASARRKDPGPRDAPTRKPRVFISGSLADSPLVQSLSEALERMGVEVSTHDSFDEATTLQAELKRALQSVDAVVPIFSQPLSRWVVAEATEAVELGREVMPVIVAGTNVPPFRKDLHRFQIKSVDAPPPALADSIAGRLKDLITPEDS